MKTEKISKNNINFITHNYIFLFMNAKQIKILPKQKLK
jgi:hypothetical protein